MKHTACMAAGLAILLGTMVASAQSLGDYARTARKHKAQQPSANRHYDNDNLPKDQQLNVVGPESGASSGASTSMAAPEANAGGTESANAGAVGTKDPKAAADERKKADDELQKKISDQKQKVDDLTRELDLAQREYKLRAAVFYADAGNRLRNSGQWDKEDARCQQEIADKQKALEAAQHDLEAVQEEGRKAGIRPKDDQ